MYIPEAFKITDQSIIEEFIAKTLLPFLHLNIMEVLK